MKAADTAVDAFVRMRLRAISRDAINSCCETAVHNRNAAVDHRTA